MTARKLRAAMTAFLLATASAGAVLVLTVPAQAQSVRAVVGKPLSEAQALAQQKNWRAAMAKVNEAEAAANKTAAESQVIAQMKNYIAVNSGDASIGGVVALRAKMANDYRAKNYREVIASADQIRKMDKLTAIESQLVAQSYFLAGDKPGCQRYIQAAYGKNAPDPVLEILMRCAYDNNDEAVQRETLETLIAHNPKPEYWKSLLKLSERQQGMRDANTLDIYRLKLLTGSMESKDDYITLAQLALQLGFASEAQAAIQKGQAAFKELNDTRTNKLLSVAQQQAGADAAAVAANIAKAKTAPDGEQLIKLGQQQVGQGKAGDAIATIQAGLAKTLKDKGDAQVRLGMAQYYAGQKGDAVKTFNAVKSPDTKVTSIAHLWALAARR
jgi:hypothetical protein